MPNRTIWNDKKIKYLKDNYMIKSWNDIAADLGCCVDTVVRKADMLGLFKNYEKGKWQALVEPLRERFGLKK